MLRLMDDGDGDVLSSKGHAEEVGSLSIVSSYRGTLLLTKGFNYLDLPLSPPQLNLHLQATIHQDVIEIKAINEFEDYFIPIKGKGGCEENIFLFENLLGKLATKEGWLFIRATGVAVIEGENIGHLEFDYEVANGITQYQFYGFEQ